MAEDGRAYPRYYVSDGIPAQIATELSVPEIYRGGGRWEMYEDREDLLVNAAPVDLAGIEVAMRAIDAAKQV